VNCAEAVEERRALDQQSIEQADHESFFLSLLRIKKKVNGVKSTRTK
jgi:hypothetical protein